MVKVYQHTSELGVTMHRPPALYDMRTPLKAQLPDQPRYLLAVLVLNGCQDSVALPSAHKAKLHSVRRLLREQLFDDMERKNTWVPGQESEVARFFAPYCTGCRPLTLDGLGPGFLV